MKALPQLLQRVEDLEAVLDAVRSPGAHPAGWSEVEVATLRVYIARGWGSGATMRAFVPARHLTPPLRAWAARAEQEGASPGAALELLGMNLGIDVRPLLPRVRTPSVVLHATGDRVVRVGNGRASPMRRSCGSSGRTRSSRTRRCSAR